MSASLSEGGTCSQWYHGSVVLLSCVSWLDDDSEFSAENYWGGGIACQKKAAVEEAEAVSMLTVNAWAVRVLTHQVPLATSIGPLGVSNTCAGRWPRS